MAMTADSEPVLAGVGVLLVELRVVVVEVRVAVADVALLVAVLVKPVEPPVGSKGSRVGPLVVADAVMEVEAEGVVCVLTALLPAEATAAGMRIAPTASSRIPSTRLSVAVLPPAVFACISGSRPITP